MLEDLQDTLPSGSSSQSLLILFQALTLRLVDASFRTNHCKAVRVVSALCIRFTLHGFSETGHKGVAQPLGRNPNKRRSQLRALLTS